MIGVKAPLVLEERLQMLCEGLWKSLELEPFCIGRLECKEVARLAGIVGAVHVGLEKDVEVLWEIELVKCENIVVVDGRCVWILEETA